MKTVLRSVLLLAVLLVAVASASAQYVGSAKSDKYHDESCRHAKNILDENRVEFASRDDAQQAGYAPCKVCRPGGDSGTSSLKSRNRPGEKRTLTPPKSTLSPGRCQAITKKGTQCKRTAKSGTNYCWQHQR